MNFLEEVLPSTADYKARGAYVTDERLGRLLATAVTKHLPPTEHGSAVPHVINLTSRLVRTKSK